MDSSGSLQSSSGDDDQEYESPIISTFLNSSNHFGSISSSPLPQFHFDPHDDSTQNFNSNFQDSTNSPYNNDLIWPNKDIRSNDHDHQLNNNFNNFGNLTSSSSIAHPYYDSTSLLPKNPSIVQPNVGKNPKKRSRASRRAPTTVLTTDTTNFRQMVQEFTGIPTTPFTDTVYTRRLDLFSTASSSLKRSTQLDNLGTTLNYPLRASTQKVQNSQFMPPFLSSSMIDTLMPTNNNSIVGTTTSSSTFDQINKSFTSTIDPCLGEIGMNHHDHEQVSANLGGGFDQYGSTFGGDQEQSRKDRNISRLLFDGNI